jgi:hypothetical protein
VCPEAKLFPRPSHAIRLPNDKAAIAIGPDQRPDTIAQRRRIREAFHDSKAKTIRGKK